MVAEVAVGVYLLAPQKRKLYKGIQRLIEKDQKPAA